MWLNASAQTDGGGCGGSLHSHFPLVIFEKTGEQTVITHMIKPSTMLFCFHCKIRSNMSERIRMRAHKILAGTRSSSVMLLFSHNLAQMAMGHFNWITETIDSISSLRGKVRFANSRWKPQRKPQTFHVSNRLVKVTSS